MGVFRKTASMCTLGLVDFRSDGERVARSARLTKRAVKAQTKQAKRLGEQQAELLRQQLTMQHQTAAAASQMASATLWQQMPPQSAVSVNESVLAGWYDDQGGDAIQRYWDGSAWTVTRVRK
ncbi:hypothetical protein BH20ACT5_BH20ACT5_04480 [soil metagenome]